RRRKKMKKQAYTTIVMFALIGLMAVAVNAQSNGTAAKLIAHIPFEFRAAGRTLPEGDYTVQQVNPSSDRAVLQLHSKDGKASVLIQMNQVIDRAKTPETARLVFARYGDQYFFSQAWMPGNDGLSAPGARADRIRNELAGVKSQTEMIALRNR